MNKFLANKRLDSQDVERLKSAGRAYHAGALSAALGHANPYYGCHYGMRSTRAAAVQAYSDGFLDALRDLESCHAAV